MFVLNVAVVKRYVELKIVDLIYITYIMYIYIYIYIYIYQNGTVEMLM